MSIEGTLKIDIQPLTIVLANFADEIYLMAIAWGQQGILSMLLIIYTQPLEQRKSPTISTFILVIFASGLLNEKKVFVQFAIFNFFQLPKKTFINHFL